jgi:diguanylate cyclase (GGDEF)-like protein
MNGTYDIALVVASYCVAVFASYVALDLGRRIAFFDGSRERFWLGAGALTMGTGVWAMHFVGMQAFELPVRLSYSLGLTGLSWVAAVGVSLLALYAISRTKLGAKGIAAGALVMGLGICIMHYSGMLAMRMSPGIQYDPMLLAASAVIAVLASAAALYISFSLRQLPSNRISLAKLTAALVMGAAICGMHYTGMAAARFSVGAICAPGNELAGNWTGLPLALVTMGLLVAVLLLSFMDARAVADRRRIEHQRAEAERVRRLAYYDSVTGLPNRSLFNESLLRQLINGGGRTPPPFGVVYAELRGYRALVEKRGQDQVNLMVKALATQLSRSLRAGDTLARLSHDGFVMLLRDLPDRDVDAGIAHAAHQFNSPVRGENEIYKLVWGLGSSRYPENGNSTQALVRAAMKLQREAGDGTRGVAQQPVAAAMGAA